MGKFMIMSPLLLLLIAKVCHADISHHKPSEQKPIYVTTEGQGPFVLSQYSSDSMPDNVVDYVRNRPTPRIEHEFNIPNENGFNVLDIADGHGTKIVYIKNTPPTNKVQPMVEVFEEQSVPGGMNGNYARKQMQGRDDNKKDSSFQSVSTFQGNGDIPPPAALQFQFPFGSFSMPIPVFVGMPPPPTVSQRFPDTNTMRDPEKTNSPLYGGPGYGGPGYGGPGYGGYPNQGGYGGGYPGGYPQGGYPGGYPQGGFGGGYPQGGFGGGYPGGFGGGYPGNYGGQPPYGGYPGGGYGNQGFYPGYPPQYPIGGPGHYGIGSHGQLGGPGPFGSIYGTPAQNEKPVSEKGQEEFDDRSTMSNRDKTQSKPIFIKPAPTKVVSAPIKTKPINKETPTTGGGGASAGMSEQLTDSNDKNKDKKDETSLSTAKPN